MKHTTSAAVIAVLISCAVQVRAGVSDVRIDVPGSSEQLPVRVMTPDTTRIFPAVVVLHDCSGLGPRSGGSRSRWAAELVKRRRGVYTPIAPLMILVGDNDDWTPAELCRRLAESAKGAAQSIRIKVYAGAHHSFDSSNPVRYNALRINGNAPGGRGATTGGNAAAWADSIREVEAFLAQHLTPHATSVDREIR